MKMKILMMLTALIYTHKIMASVSVGVSPGFGTCTYATLSEALADGDSEIRVVNSETYSENLVIDHSVNIRGGFGSCLLAQLNINTGTNTSINAENSIEPTISIELPELSFHVIKLEKLTISGGNSGVSILLGFYSLEISNSVILQNQASVIGGGILMYRPNDSSSLVMNNSSIWSNQAPTQGGGIYCAGENATITLDHDVLLLENSATDGGGIFATEQCTIRSFAGSNPDLSGDLAGLINNSATSNGGGIYAELGAKININGNVNGPYGNNEFPALFSGNSAGESGGGLYATNNNTNLGLVDTVFSSNESMTSGGGIFLNDLAGLEISANSNCWSPSKCNSFEYNRAIANGGGIYIASRGGAVIGQTNFHHNRADIGTSLYIRDQFSNAFIQSSLFYANGDNGTGNYDDQFDIRSFSSAELVLTQITSANNLNTVASIGINNDRMTEIHNSIIYTPGLSPIAESGTAVNSFYCLALNESSGINGDRIESYNPSFVDPLNYNFHIPFSSAAVDVCENRSFLFTTDIDSQNFGFDSPNLGNIDGPYDVGADEYQPDPSLDIIFISGFESGI